MLNESVHIGEAISMISIWISKINLANAVSFYDINKVSEGVSQQLLNLVFEYKLEDLNTLRPNYPGIDLGDTGESKIAFQITSRKDVTKIKHTLRIFYEKKLNEIFSGGLKFLILANNGAKPKKIAGYESCFNTNSDIFHPADLIKEITKIYRTDLPRFEQILALLRKEFGTTPLENSATPSLIDFKDPDSQINFYTETQKLVYKEQLGNFVPFKYIMNGREDSTDSLPIIFESSVGIIILGPSGCGKSLLGKKIAYDFIENNTVSLFLEAKYYEKNLNKLVDDEAQKFNFSSGLTFFKICKQANKKILLVVDGLNECSIEKQIKLSVELSEVLTQHGLSFIITAQTENDALLNLNGATVYISLPDMELKKSIVDRYFTVTHNMNSILAIIKTSMEARILGELGDLNISGLSRFELFELYLRRIIDDDFKEFFALLTIIAERLMSRLSFSISTLQLDMLIRENKLELSNLERYFKYDLLNRNSNKISFTHEMWLNFFSAASITKNISEANLIVGKLAEPKNSENRLFILGSIEDHSTLDVVLENITDSEIIKSLILGEGGKYAQIWAKTVMAQIIKTIEEDVQDIQFEITEDQYWPVRIKPDTSHDWTEQQWGFICTLPDLLFKELYLSEIFLITGKMDTNCEEAFQRLLQEAREKKVSLRSGIFNAIYGNNRPGFSKCAIACIFQSLASGFASFDNPNEIRTDTIEYLLKIDLLSNGQFYLLLNLCKYSERAELLYPYILDALSRRWKSIPYALKNELLLGVGHCYKTEEQRTALIDVLNEIHTNTRDAFLSTNIFEALASVGALTDDATAYEGVVKDQVTKILSDPQNDKFFYEAAGIFYAQFDHPYDIAFQNVVSKLDGDDAKAFYRMAIQGDTTFIFTCSLIFTTVEILGKEACPYLVRFIHEPVSNKTMPQDSLEVFITVSILLGQFAYPVNSSFQNAEDELSKTLLACGEIYYWINRPDLNSKEKHVRCKAAASFIFESITPYSVEAIWQSRHAFLHSYRRKRYLMDVVLANNFFSDQIADCARKAITFPTNQKSIFGFDREEDIIKHAIWLLEDCGNIRDLKLLKQLAEHRSYGTSAVRAIKKLESDHNL